MLHESRLVLLFSSALVLAACDDSGASLGMNNGSDANASQSGSDECEPETYRDGARVHGIASDGQMMQYQVNTQYGSIRPLESFEEFELGRVINGAVQAVAPNHTSAVVLASPNQLVEDVLAETTARLDMSQELAGLVCIREMTIEASLPP